VSIRIAGSSPKLEESIPRLSIRPENLGESHSFKTIVSAAPEFNDGGAGNAIVIAGEAWVQFSDNQRSRQPVSLQRCLHFEHSSRLACDMKEGSLAVFTIAFERP
jgi:hypothetical protein